MVVRIARGVRKQIRDNPRAITLQVRGAADVDVAASALRQARAEIAELDAGWRSAPGLGPGDTNGPKSVGEVLVTSIGPFITVDGGHTPDKMLQTIPDIVVRHVVGVGITEAIVAFPDDRPLAALGDVPRAVWLTVCPPPSERRNETGKIPPDWLHEACRWAQGELGDRDELWAAIDSVEFPLAAGDGFAFLDECQRSRAATSFLVAAKAPAPAPKRPRGAGLRTHEEQLAGDLERIGGRLRAVNGCFSVYQKPPTLALAAGGPDTSDDELVESFEELREIARRLAPHVVYASIIIEETFRDFSQVGGAGELCDIIVPGAFAYQILGPRHLQRLGGMPAGARPLPGGRAELTIARPSAWLGPTEHAARRLLAPCLIKGYGASLPVRNERYEANAFEARDELPTGPSPSARTDDSARQRVMPANERVQQPYIKPLSTDGLTIDMHERVGRLSRLASLSLYPPPPSGRGQRGQLSPRMLEKAAAWVVEGPVSELWGTDLEDYCRAIPVPVNQAASFLNLCAAQASQTPVSWVTQRASPVAFDAAGRCRIATAEFYGYGGTAYLTLRGGGPGLRGHTPADEDVIATFASFRQLARSLAPEVAYAFIDIGGTVGRLNLIDNGRASWSWYSQGGEHPGLMAPLCDEYVVDAFAYQILSPGHLRRLGGVPASARPLPGNRVELAIGEPLEWLNRAAHTGRGRLARCLADNQSGGLRRARYVANDLARVGAGEALANLADRATLHDVSRLPRAVVLRLYLAPRPDRLRQPLPRHWIDEAEAWVTAGLEDDTELWAAVESTVQFRLPARHLSSLLGHSRLFREPPESMIVMSESREIGVRGAHVCPMGSEANLVLAGGGPAANDHDLLALVDELKQCARRLVGEVGYAFINVEGDFSQFAATFHATDRSESFARLSGRCTYRWESLVLDAFPYQVVGAGHVARLGEIPPGAVALDPQHLELSIGEGADWLLDNLARPEAIEAARTTLSVLLLQDGGSAQSGLSHHRA